jgi:ABC-type uncharacterized transport system substrate-binding protein
MNHKIYLLILTGALLFCSCSLNQKADEAVRIVYVNSYHEGYGSSDDVMEGIVETLQGENIELKKFFLDAKRKTVETDIQESVQHILREIQEFNPALMIVSDDNAVKELVVPYFNNSSLPVVFCGVNWSAEQYGLGSNITGMLEVLPLRECLKEVVSNYPETKRLVVLSENSLSEQNNRLLLDTLYRNMGLEVTYKLADDFEAWKAMFLEANSDADLIYMPTNGAIKNWDNNSAREIIENHVKIPVVTCDDFMMPYAVFGLTKVAKEQGVWAAKTAMEVLHGKSPADIPQTRNREMKAWLNDSLAARINFRISEQMKSQVTHL